MNAPKAISLRSTAMSRGSRLLFGLSLVLYLMTISNCATGVPTGNSSSKLHPSKIKERVCLSLRMLAIEARANLGSDTVKNLGGIGWFEGYVIDRENRDIILVGRRSEKWPCLHLDDLVVNIRNVWNREPHPYCSLNPRGADVLNLNKIASKAGIVTSVEQMHALFRQIKNIWGPQEVIVRGVPRNSRHAHVMIDADYHMKKLSQGSAEVEGVHSYIDFALAQAQKMIEQEGAAPALGVSMSRFWFHIGKGEPTYQESQDIICLEKCSVVVLTEKQRAAEDGTLFDSGGDDPYARKFAQCLSEQFEYADTVVPKYADLENLFRLSALLRAMHFRKAIEEANLDFRFYLKDFDYQMETLMEPSLPGLVNSKEGRGVVTKGGSIYQYVLFPIVCGGVSMEIPVSPEQFKSTETKRLYELRQAVLKFRPKQNALWWALPEL